MSDDDFRTPIRWLGSVQIAGSDEFVPVLEDGREGSKVFVRLADPADGEPTRVPLHQGDEVVVMTALSHITLNTQAEPGPADELILPIRIVPVRREGGQVYVRTLRSDETDKGDRVHVRPGDDVTIEQGAMIIELAAIDRREAESFPADAYVPVTAVLGSWLALRGLDDDTARYLLALARRLDAAALLSERIQELWNRLDEDLGAAATRRLVLELIRTTEIAIVTFGRVSNLIQKARANASVTTSIPNDLNSAHSQVKELRDAYEHIEERSIGRVYKSPNPAVLAMFDYSDLIRTGSVHYLGFSLNVRTELPELIQSARQFIIDAAGNH